MNRCLLFLLLCLLPFAAAADEVRTLGWGRLFDNDVLGDLRDRWQSGGYTVSVLRGPGWNGHLPAGFGKIVEYRVSASTVTPANLTQPAPDDRRYAAPLSAGVHSQFDLEGVEANLGAGLVLIGPQTGVGRFQAWLHGVLGVAKPDLADQLGNAIYPTVQAEFGRSFAVTKGVSMRPFVAGQVGVETLLRAGGDVVVGRFGQGALMLRDDTTGQRYLGIPGGGPPALSLTLGADVAQVFNSALLPDQGLAVASDTRGRLRAGLAWQGETSSAFYGLTYLSPEFDSQPTGQVVGSVNFNFRF